MRNDIATEQPRTLLEEATEWYLILSDPEVSDRALNDWQAWLARSALHREAFSEVQEIMQLSSRVADVPWPDENELLGDAYRGDVSIESWQSRAGGAHQTRFEARQPEKSVTSWAWRIAAAVLLGIGIGLVWWAGMPGPAGDDAFAVHETAAAEHRELALSDGSVISLGARTLISVAYTDQHRRILLERGEAYFEVAKDKRRPFEVRAGSRIIKAVGTAFNVTRHSERVVVAVTEGVVVVEEGTALTGTAGVGGTAAVPATDARPARLEAGQQFAYTNDSGEAVETADPAAVTAWREGRLKYRSEPLRHVLEDVNRYSPRNITLGNDTIGEMTFTGTVFHDRIDDWLASIEQAFPLYARRTRDGGIVLLPKDDQAIDSQTASDLE